MEDLASAGLHSCFRTGVEERVPFRTDTEVPPGLPTPAHILPARWAAKFLIPDFIDGKTEAWKIRGSFKVWPRSPDC